MEPRKDDLESLPPELILYIFTHLPIKDLLSLNLVNRFYKSLADDNAVWKQKYIKLEQKVLASEMKTPYENFFLPMIQQKNYKQRYQALNAFIKNQQFIKYSQSFETIHWTTVRQKFVDVTAYLFKGDKLSYDITYELLEAQYQSGNTEKTLKIISNIIDAKSTCHLYTKIPEKELFTLPALNKTNDYYFRGSLYLKLSKLEEALSDFEKASQLGYAEPKLFVAIGDCQFALGHFTEAKETYNKFLHQSMKEGKGLEDPKVIEVEEKIKQIESQIGDKGKSANKIATEGDLKKPGLFSSEKTNSASEKATAREELIKKQNKL